MADRDHAARDREPIDDAVLGAFVRDAVRDWQLPPQRIDQPGWRERVEGRPRRRGRLARLSGTLAAALVGTLALALAAVWLSLPRTPAEVGASPDSAAASARPSAPAVTAPPSRAPDPTPGTPLLAFGQSSAITGGWVTDNTPALTIAVPAGDEHIYYWRAIAYDRFDLNGWSLSGTDSTTLEPGTAILGGTREEAEGTAITREVSFGVTPLAYRGTTVFSPYAPSVVDHQVRASLLGGQFLSTLDLAAAGPYVVTARVPATTLDDPDGLTENKLRAAGRQYPPEVQNLYTTLALGAVGPRLRELRDTILGITPGDDPTPYDIARSTVAYLRSDQFTYSTDVTDVNCGDRSVAECFAEFRAGYCQHYATTMAVLLRMQNIPARLVQGFLPGERDANGTETIRYSNSHAWVEAFFPGYGWVAFDPTGGGVAQLEPLPAGPPVSSFRPSSVTVDGGTRTR